MEKDLSTYTLKMIREKSDVHKAMRESFEKPVYFFKHSISCPVSDAIYKEMSLAASPAYLIVVQYHRELSDMVAEILGIEHHTPQVILVRNGRSYWHASHSDIISDVVDREYRDAQ